MPAHQPCDLQHRRSSPSHRRFRYQGRALLLMSSVYLVRHGQAGTRDSYDSLSELGRRQSRLLGEYLLSQGIEFTAAYSGALLRQQQTAVEISTAYARATLPFPEII